MKSRVVKILSVLACIAIVTVMTVSMLAMPVAAVNYSFFSKDDIDPSTYAYSFALIGDTQTISIKDVQNAGKEGYESKVEALYKWIADNKDKKKIKFVMGLGDIVETWQTSADFKEVHDAEWALNAKAIAQLDEAKIPYTLVRGNHDTDSSFNNWVETEMKSYQSQFDGINGKFMYTDKYDTAYQKIEIGGTKWLIMALDWAVTGAELDWAAEVIKNSPDYKVILTMHNYLNHDMTIDANGDTQDSGFPNPGWDYSIDPTSPDNDPNLVYNPDGIWYRLVSKHENISMVISGHRPNDSVQRSQLIGDNGNTITQLLVDPQGMDKNSKYNGGAGLGMVCMLYFSENGETVTVGDWDGSTVHMEWYSTVLDQYFKDENQVTLDLDLYDGAIDTAYGKIPAAYADCTFAIFGYDSDIDEYFFHGGFNSWSDENGAYRGLARFSGKKPKATILLRKDYQINDGGEKYAISGLSVNLDIDLNGHTITVTNTEKPFLHANISKASTNNIRIFGKEGSALINTSEYTSFINMGASGTDCAGSVTNITFDGITFKYGVGSTAPILVAQTFNMASTNNSPVTAEQNLVFNNCTFDLKTNKPADTSVSLFQLNETVSSGYNVQIANVELKGGEIIASNLTDATVYTKNNNDKFIYGKNSEGSMTKFTLDSGNQIVTENGTIPEEWADSPYIVFFNKEAIGATSTLPEAFNLAKTKLTSSESEVLISLRTSKTEKFTNSSLCRVDSAGVMGTLKIDLGKDNTLTTSGKALFQLNAKDSGEFTLEVTNGTLNSVRLIALSTQTNLTSDTQKFNVIFKNINLGLTASPWDEMISTNAAGIYTGSAVSNITFEDCRIDLKTNQSKNPYTFLQLKNDVNIHKTNVVFKGSEIIFGENAVNFCTVGETLVDTVSFEKNSSGKYTIFSYPSGAAAPTDTYGNTGCAYKPVSDDGTTAKYTLVKDVIVDGYGTIPFDYADESVYPFVLFSDGVFKSAYKSWYGFLKSLSEEGSKITTESTLLLRADYTTGTAEDTKIKQENGSVDRYIYMLGAHLTIDLGNHTLKKGSSQHLLQLFTYGKTYSLTIKNGYVGIVSGHAPIVFNDSEKEKGKIDLTFENVTFVVNTAEPIAVGYSGGAGYDCNLTLNNCIIDTTGNTNSVTLFKLDDANDKYAVKLQINGGKLITDSNTAESFNFVTLNPSDTLSFDSEFVIEAPSNASLETIPTMDGTWYPIEITDNGTTATYYYASNFIPGYGEIDFEYISAIEYPFALFIDGEFISAATCWADGSSNPSALKTAHSTLDIAAYKGKTIDIVLRRNYSVASDSGAYSNLGLINGKVHLDLNDKTLTLAGSPLMTLGVKSANTSVYVENGTVLMTSRELLALSSASNNGAGQSMSAIFENVNIGFASGATSNKPVVTTFGMPSVTGVSTTTVEFIDCSFDLVTNAPSSITFFDLATDASNSKNEITLKGGTLKLKDFAKFTFAVLREGDDKVEFSKNDSGKYLTLLLADTSVAPTLNSVFYTEGDSEMVFTVSGSSAGFNSYTLMPKSVVTFAPKTSVTLYTDFRYNIYLPKTSALSAVSLNSEALDVSTLEVVKLGGEDFYKLPACTLKSFEALGDITLTVTLTDGTDSYKGSFTLDLYSYANTVIASGSTFEKALAKDMLSYVSAAYDMWNKTSDKLAAIDTLLGEDYDANNAPTMNKEIKTPGASKFESVTFYLGEAPAYRFYYSGTTAPSYTFKVGSRVVDTTLGSDNVEGNYVEVKVYAYELLKGISFTDGTNTYEYNVYSYYSQATDASVKHLVERLVKYCESANAYRESVKAAN